MISVSDFPPVFSLVVIRDAGIFVVVEAFLSCSLPLEVVVFCVGMMSLVLPIVVVGVLRSSLLPMTVSDGL